ncbi:MAG: sulfatase-like hydrolase/transferase [Fuerstiella sp.]
MRKLILTILLAVPLTSVCAATARPQRPDIVIILVDDMGFSDIGGYGGEIPTPNLDQLANDGLRFTQFYNTGRCCPTRAALLTGLYAHQAGMGHMTNDYGVPGYGGHGQNAATSRRLACRRRRQNRRPQVRIQDRSGSRADFRQNLCSTMSGLTPHVDKRRVASNGNS